MSTSNKNQSCELLFPSPLISGQSLYLGGSYCPITDKLYCIPGHAQHVLIIDPSTDTCYPMNHPPIHGQFKYLRSIYVAETQQIYGLPCNADNILKIDPIHNTVMTLPIPFETSEQRQIPWKYHGGAIHPIDKCIYAIPQSATHVLKLDPQTDEISLIGPELPGKYKWYGGVVGKTDHAIYGIPHNSSSILRIDINDQVTLHGDFTQGGHKWHGAAVSSSQDGTIVAIPANADTVLLITPAPEPMHSHSTSDGNIPSLCTFQQIGGPDIIKTGRHRTDGKYKYLGAVSSPHDHKVYCLPSGSEQVLQIDVQTLQVRNVGPNIRDGTDLNCRERMRQNKWQNGFYSPIDHCVYGIPLNGETVLKIQTFATDCKNQVQKDPIVTTIPLPDPKGGLSKWEGGVMANNGNMYCMPNNHKAVLKIVPGKSTLKFMNEDHFDNKEKILTSSSSSQASSNHPKTIPTPESINQSQSSEHKTITPSSSSPATEDLEPVYTTGIPTLRSSAHRVKHNRKGKGKQSKNKQNQQKNQSSKSIQKPKSLPLQMKREKIISYNPTDVDLRTPILEMLQRVNPSIVGTWKDSTPQLSSSLSSSPPISDLLHLEHFQVPTKTLSRLDHGGICEDAQKYLSDFVSDDEHFLSIFDQFVTTFIIPSLKAQLLECESMENSNNGHENDENKQNHQSNDPMDDTPTVSKIDQSNKNLTFYYQRPPTLRLQPGPSRSHVKTHRDSEYGHQDGEMNYWIPLTDPNLTQLTIWVESSSGKGDYHPMNVQYGEVAIFHGSSCRHYVPMNKTTFTRMSLDFRVGIEGYFDSEWMMEGTTDDHNRQKVEF